MAIKSITRISTGANGVEGNSWSYSPVFSPDGSRVAFMSFASNLVPGDTNNGADIFIKDLATGAIERISTAADGAEGNSSSQLPSFSPDGSRVVFSSDASNLVPGDTDNSADIFIKDLATGAIERIFTYADEVQTLPVFSPDGSKVAFTSDASHLVPGDTNGFTDIFIKDLATGAIERISTTADGAEGNGSSSFPVFSPDGSKVVFSSISTNLVSGTAGLSLFVKDLTTGAIASIMSDTEKPREISALETSFSPDGSKVAFNSWASNLVPGDTNGAPDIFVVELDDAWVSPPPAAWSITPQSVRLNEADGTVTFTVTRSDPIAAQTVYVSTVQNQGSSNEGDYVGKLNEPVEFAAGQSIQTVSIAVTDDAVAGEPDETFGLIVQQSETDPVTTFLASATFTIQDNDAAPPPSDLEIVRASAGVGGSNPSLSDDGRFVAFTGSGVGNQIFVRDLQTNVLFTASSDADGNIANGLSSNASMSGNGEFVSFTSRATNLVGDDTNGDADIFVKNLKSGSIVRATTDKNGSEVQFSISPEDSSLSSTGRYTVFDAYGRLVADQDRLDGIYVKDTESQNVVIASTDASGNQTIFGSYLSPSISDDGRFVAFISNDNGLVANDTNGYDLFVKDLTTQSIVRANVDADGNQANSGFGFGAVMAGSGRHVAFTSSATNLVPNDTSSRDDVFVKDLETGTIVRASTDANGNEGDGTSGNVDGVPSSSFSISNDGRFVAFDSSSDNLVPNDTGLVDVFVKDLKTGAISRVNTDADGNPANNLSTGASISGDGRFIAFQSSASNLVPGDSGVSVDVFVVANPLYDDETPPQVTYSITPQSVRVNEADGTVTFTVTRSDPTAAQTVFVSTLQNQGSTNDGDYVGKLNEPVEFAAGQSIQTVSIAVTDDAVAGEPDETFGLIVQQSETNPVTTFLASATFTIQDNDAAPPPAVTYSITPQSVRVNEADGTITFTVTRSEPTAAQTVFVSTVQSQGFSNEGDYVSKENEELVFAAGDDQETVTIDILDDEAPEDDEMFGLIVQASPADPLTTHLASASFTIEDDDTAEPTDDLELVSPYTPVDLNVEGDQVRQSVKEWSDTINFASTELFKAIKIAYDLPKSWDLFVSSNLDQKIHIFKELANKNPVVKQLPVFVDIFIAGLTAGEIVQDGSIDLEDRNKATDFFISLASGKAGYLFGQAGAIVVAGGTGSAALPIIASIGLGYAAAISFEYLATTALESFTDYESVNPTTLEVYVDKVLDIFYKDASYSSQLNLDRPMVYQDNLLYTADVERKWSINVDTGEYVSLRETDPEAWNRSAQRLGIETGTEPISLVLAGDRDPDNAEDLLIGGVGPDQVFGGGGDDRLAGLGGNDYLRGGPGVDELLGGSGADTFAGSPSEQHGDIILDFTSEDILRFEGVRFTSENLLVASGSAILNVDSDGDGATDTIVTVEGNFPGTFKVTPSDADGEAFTAITFAPNLAPIANDDSYDARNGIALGSVNLFDNDSDPEGDPLEVAGFDYAGTGTLDVRTDGTFSYTPVAGFAGTDTFTYTIRDAFGAEDSATVSLSVPQPEPEPLNVITGTARINKLVGTGGNDLIWGLAGNDWLEGKDGDDILIGGKHTDGLTGGRGGDLFVIDALSLMPDTIFDFKPSEGDRLSLGPLIDSLGLREGEADLDAPVGVTRLGKNLAITLDTNGADARGGVRAVALLFRPETTDPQQILSAVDTDPPSFDHDNLWV